MNAEPRATRLSYTFDWIVSRICSDSSNTNERSSAASGPYWEVGIGSQNSIRHLDGSGTTPSGPSAGKVGVIGKYGAPISRAISGASATFGQISSLPTTATGTIGAPVRRAISTKPP